MLMVIDIGNTNIAIGYFKSEKKNISHHFKISTQKGCTSDELGTQIKFLFQINKLNYKVHQIICSNVVPSMNKTISDMAKKYFNSQCQFVSLEMKTDIKFDYPNPEEIGADRIVNAVAVNELYGNPAIIIDFGTATTFCVLSTNNEYLGGLICPGLNASMNILSQKAAQLPHVHLSKPKNLIGKSTIQAMHSGIFYGALYALEGIVKQLKLKFNLKNAKIIATGGLSKILYESTKTINIIDCELTLKGLQIIYRKNL